jgi:hypothetical protein
MNSKVKISQARRGLVCVKNKRCTQLAQSQSDPGQPLPAPNLEDPIGFNKNYSVCIQCHLVF